MAGRLLLRDARICSRNVLPFGNWCHLGETPERGRSRETGPRAGAWPGGGAWRRQSRATGQPVRRGRARPLHLIHGGASSDSVRQERLNSNRPGSSGSAGADPVSTVWQQRAPATVAGGSHGRCRLFAGTSGFIGLPADTRAGCPVAKTAVTPAPAFVRDLIYEVLVGGASEVSCQRPCAHPLRVSWRPVCTSMWITCAKRHQTCAHAVEMLGIPPPGRPHIRAFSWENTIHTLCILRRLELSTRHAAIAHI